MIPNNVDLSTIDYDKALELISDQIDVGAAMRNVLFFEGDHWQSGEGWIGPILDTMHPLYQTTYQSIEAMFVSTNKVLEVVRRERDAACGRPPSWALIYSDKAGGDDSETDETQQAILDEAETIFRRWFDERHGLKKLQKAVENAMLTGRGVLRLMIPAGLRDETGVIRAATPQEALDYIYLDALSPFEAAVIEVPDTKQRIGLYAYEIETEGNQKERRVEVTYINNGMTVLSVLNEDGVPLSDPVEMIMGGYLLMNEAGRKPLVTEQMRSIQRALNMVETMLARNTVQGGFLERYFFNAQLPVKEKIDPVTGQVVGYEPAPMRTGPGTSQFLAGVVTQDEAGNENIATPSAFFHEPSPAIAFVETSTELYQRFLEEASQIHIMITSDATPSGKSREEARAEFESAILESARLVEQFMEWLVNATLALAADIAGHYNAFTHTAVQVQASITATPLNGLEQDSIIKARDAGVISTATARSKIGVDDIVKEALLVEQDKEDSADLLTKRAQAVSAFVMAGASLYSAALAAGFDEEVANALITLPPVDQNAEY
jgi:hypothetical protein